jgi:hypothetical protein
MRESRSTEPDATGKLAYRKPVVVAIGRVENVVKGDYPTGVVPEQVNGVMWSKSF